MCIMIVIRKVILLKVLALLMGFSLKWKNIFQKKMSGQILIRLIKLTQVVEDNKIQTCVDPRSFNLETALEAQDAVENKFVLIKVVIDVI